MPFAFNADRRVLIFVAVAACLAAIPALVLLECRHCLDGSRVLWSAGIPVQRRPPTALPPQQDRLYGVPLRRRRLGDGDAAVFEPTAYRRYYPDIGNGTDVSDSALVEHYLAHGRAENRVSQRLRVVGTYEAGAGLAETIMFGGLCNQIYSHVPMLSVLLQMGVEVFGSVSSNLCQVLPDAVHRGGNAFKDSFWNNQVVPVRAPLDTLFDVNHMLAWAASIGAVIHTAAPPMDGALPISIAGASMGCCNTMEHLVDVIHSTILNTVQGFLTINPERDQKAPLPVVALNLVAPMLMNALRTDATHMDLIEEVSRALRPSPAIRAAADAIVGNLTDSGDAFNGLHLRMEDDTNYKKTAGSEQELLKVFINATLDAEFNATTPLYVASGLLTYMPLADFQTAIAVKFTERRVCSGLVLKEQLLDSSLTEGLMSESLALVDLLVLAHARHFAGLTGSSFSWVVREYRCLRGLPPSTTTMASVAGEMPWHLVAAGALSNHSRTCPEPAS